jgi:hypothetical protein
VEVTEMRRTGLTHVALLAILAPILAGVLRAQEEPILDSYSLQVGSADAVGVTAHVVDDFFGHGDAHARLLFVGPKKFQDPTSTGTLSLRVWRKVPRDTISFALLADRVEVRGFDAEGELVESRELPGFVFGDSASGKWNRTLEAIPADVARIEVTIFGNYE